MAWIVPRGQNQPQNTRPSRIVTPTVASESSKAAGTAWPASQVSSSTKRVEQEESLPPHVGARVAVSAGRQDQAEEQQQGRGLHDPPRQDSVKRGPPSLHETANSFSASER